MPKYFHPQYFTPFYLLIPFVCFIFVSFLYRKLKMIVFCNMRMCINGVYWNIIEPYETQ